MAIHVSEKNRTLPLRKHIIDLSPAIHGGLVHKASLDMGVQESNIIDMSASLNPLGSPFDYPGCDLDLDDLLEESRDSMYRYPDNRYLEFREAAASFAGPGLEACNIVPGNGSCELIRLVAECALEKDDVVLIPQPTFAEYEQQARICGGRIEYIGFDDLFELTDEQLEMAKMLFVCNPNNPTGNLIPRKDLIELAKRCVSFDVILFVDEAFIELSSPDQSIADQVVSSDHLIVLRSLTKNFAIPGIRLGFCIASSDMAAVLNNARLSWDLGAIPDVVGTALLNMEGGCNSDYLIESRRFIEKERRYLLERLSDIYGFDPLPGHVNYVLVDVSTLLMDSVELTWRLESHGILIRDCSSFATLDRDYVRIAVRTRGETGRLIQAIGDVLTESGKEYAEMKLKKAIEKASSDNCGASRNTCEYYPCHFPGQDCTFCFCPFYPCEDERTGGKWIDSTTGGKVWSCEDCTIVHRPGVVKDILEILMEDADADGNLARAWNEVIEPIL